MDEKRPDLRERQRAHHPQVGHLDGGIQADVRAWQGLFGGGRNHFLALIAPLGFGDLFEEGGLLHGRGDVFDQAPAVGLAVPVAQVIAAIRA